MWTLEVSTDRPRLRPLVSFQLRSTGRWPWLSPGLQTRFGPQNRLGGLGDRSSGTPEGAGGLTNGPVPGGKPPPTPPRLVGKPESPEETTAHESISSESLRHTVAF
ncbi:hypothetical protein TYRP_012189 [Tyrophagus putrescentiae]|nr:hypothetical protein TYRP_012189 [Tyrophagus putrescentiae]